MKGTERGSLKLLLLVYFSKDPERLFQVKYFNTIYYFKPLFLAPRNSIAVKDSVPLPGHWLLLFSKTCKLWTRTDGCSS